jgi:alkylmercury lyase-like protein
MTITQTQPTLAQRVRLFIFEYFREHAVPPVVEQLMSDFDLSRSDAVALLSELTAARHIALVKGTSRILMAFPFSAIATPFRVIASGRTYFANCAWDAIAFHAMLGTDIAIDSYCHHCAMPISIEMSGGRTTRVEPAGVIVYLGLRPAQWWDEIVTTCSNTMVFFASVEHRDASDISAAAGQPDKTASLTPDQVHALGVPLYSGKLSIDYVRPGRDELMAHFASIGLTGPYWQL